MAKQVIEIGSRANDGTGDSIRLGAQKINDNFTELYLKSLPSQTGQGGKYLTTDGALVTWEPVTVSNITGNAATVTNGIYTNSSYSNPSWITSLDSSKVLPSQLSHAGEFLTTNGSAISWGSVPVPPDQLQSDWAQSNTASLDFIKNKPTIPTNTNQLANGAGFLTSNGIPNQTGNTGKYLSTDGSTLYWNTVDSSTQLQSDWSQSNIAALDFIKNKPTINTLVPSQTGNSGKYLSTDGSTVSWASSSGLGARLTVSATTASLASGVSGNITASGFKGYALLSIQVSAGAWVTVYTSSAAQSADSSRSISTDPTPGSGVVAEAVTTTATTTYFSPAVIGYSSEAVPTTNVPLKVYNNSGSTATITVTLTLLKLEV